MVVLSVSSSFWLIYSCKYGKTAINSDKQSIANINATCPYLYWISTQMCDKKFNFGFNFLHQPWILCTQGRSYFNTNVNVVIRLGITVMDQTDPRTCHRRQKLESLAGVIDHEDTSEAIVSDQSVVSVVEPQGIEGVASGCADTMIWSHCKNQMALGSISQQPPLSSRWSQGI